MIPFNKPYLSGKETQYIQAAASSGKLSGNGEFTKKCHTFFQAKYGMHKTLLTTSCTDALEMSAILAGIEPGDEVIMPSYTFVSTANAFILRGAKVVFADSNPHNPNLDVAQIESLITPKTKAVVPVHYAGMACDMDALMHLANKYQFLVIEDAAQAIDAFYNGKPLGTIGHLAAFSFHETKNIISGEGGMLVINDERFFKRAEIIWEKGTNRAEFFRGEANKYGWVDVGSSFLPSEITSAFLYAQLENLESIQSQRIKSWHLYAQNLKDWAQKGYFELPQLDSFASNNAHMFYLVLPDADTRTAFIAYLKQNGILSVFHYLPLHLSEFFKDQHDGRPLPHAVSFSERLVRLPLYFELKPEEIEYICQTIGRFFQL